MNCVSRLRKLARVIPGDKICRTLFSRQTLLQGLREDLIWRSVGRLQMKGREQVEDVLELNVVNAMHPSEHATHRQTIWPRTQIESHKVEVLDKELFGDEAVTLFGQCLEALLKGQIQRHGVSKQQGDGRGRIETTVPAQRFHSRLWLDALEAGFPDDPIGHGCTEQSDANLRWVETNALKAVLCIGGLRRRCQAAQIHEQWLWSLGRTLQGPK